MLESGPGRRGAPVQGAEEVDPTSTDVFELAQRRLAWLDRRTAVLAQNVANADTPGWQAKDLPAFSAALGQAGVTPLRTNPMHLAGTVAEDPTARPIGGESSADGNSVQLDVELSKLSDTENAQALVNNLWQAYVGLFSTALGK
jgi:flagellar basal-body rod protein FlgB